MIKHYRYLAANGSRTISFLQSFSLNSTTLSDDVGGIENIFNSVTRRLKLDSVMEFQVSAFQPNCKLYVEHEYHISSNDSPDVYFL